jgi:hypothetical protein
VVYSTPAGERRRPRVRRSHEEKTRGGVLTIPRFVSITETGFQIVDSATGWRSSRDANSDFPHRLEPCGFGGPPAAAGDAVAALSATGERRQDFNLYGLAELAFEIFLVSRTSIDQY